MLFRRFYYHFKPFLPWRLRLGLRRAWYRRQRALSTDVWPINPAAKETPKGWTGWPDGKTFAFVLTHDVETGEGMKRCQSLMEVEKSMGFRSSFNFIPEGGYAIPDELRGQMAADGFEVGVHDLKHDGKLYRDRAKFRQNAQSINRYLKDWNAVGFRSGFMLHNLEWLHDLDIRYDASTFDTDPFEPQPDGVDTIFPFFVRQSQDGTSKSTQGSCSQETVDDGQWTESGAANSEFRIQNSELRDQGFASSRLRCSTPHSALRTPHSKGYVELPYTLPQDFSLFILMQEKTPEIWKQKLDWIAENRAMALLDVHPDYMRFNGDPSREWTYPAKHYQDFLDYVRTRYHGRFWHPLPRKVAEFVQQL